MIEEEIHACTAFFNGLLQSLCAHLAQTIGREQVQHQGQGQIHLMCIHALAAQKTSEVSRGRVGRVELRHRWDQAEHFHTEALCAKAGACNSCRATASPNLMPSTAADKIPPA